MIQIVCFLCVFPQISNIFKRFTLQKQIPRLFPIEAVKFISIWVWNISSILSLQLLLSLSLLYIFHLLWLFFSYLFLQLYYAIMSKGAKEQTLKKHCHACFRHFYPWGSRSIENSCLKKNLCSLSLDSYMQYLAIQLSMVYYNIQD